MSTKMPKVSICIPTYNYGQFIAETIESVLAQTYADYELIVVDNCSSDDTRSIVAAYVAKDERIRYFCNESNLGMVGNWNRCLTYVRGEYVKILCSDDLLAPSCIERSMEFFDKHPSVSLVTCIRQIVDKELKPMTVVAYAESSGIERGSDVIRRCFFEGNLIGEPTAVMFRRKDAVRGFDSRFKQLIDLEMWLHLLEKGDLAFIAEVLCSFRQHEEQGTKSSIREFTVIDDELLLREAYLGKSYIGDSWINLLRWKFHLALIIWNHRKYGADSATVKMKLAQHYPLILFYVSLYFVKAKQRILRIMKS